MEEVLVFEEGRMEGLKELPGISLSMKDMQYFATKIVPFTHYMDREIAEETPKFKQIIPYIIFQKGDELLCYKRNAKGKENRLRKKYSIGIGGHINPIDGQGVDAISNAVTRELGEELKEFKIETVELYGLLYDPSDEVGRVHFGLIVLVTVAEDTVVESAEEEIENPTWIKLDKLRKLKNLENWSKLILDKKE